MSGWLCMTVEVKKGRLAEFLKKCHDIYISIQVPKIAVVYNWDDDQESTIIFDVESLGYAEPTMFYGEVKDMVKDIHVVDMSCVDGRVGKDRVVTAWSCKKKHESGMDVFPEK